LVTTRVAINGFGRIGRLYLRASLAHPDLQVVAINDLTPTETNAHLLKYDSTQGRLEAPVSFDDDGITVGDETFKVLAERDPLMLPWRELDIDVVNESSYEPDRHHIVSNASCTTNCFVPMVKVLDDAFGVESGLMTTIHAYTNDQNLLDLTHKDLRRARAAAINIVPSSTGAARATSLVLASMKGRLDGTSLRVPVPTGSITDFTAIVRSTTVEQVNAAFKEAADGPLKGVLVYTDEPIVSSDIVGSPASCTFDSLMTMVLAIDEHKSLVKVFGWYDNEWGYSNRLVDLTSHIGP
jgi:glyceraldehyde 3-phosphate dehydrogenase